MTVKPIPALRVGVLVTAIATVVMNALANALPIAGRTTGAISDAYFTTITPAGYVFSIWLVIYVGLVGYAVWQALPAQRANARAQAVAAPVIVANLANATWILAWHHLWFGTSLLIMLVLLGALIVTYGRLRAVHHPAPARAERVWAFGTFSVYLGWITVATVANVSVYLVSLGWQGGFLPAQVWGALTLVVATVLGVRLLLRESDLAYAAVLVWAFVGIVVAHTNLWFVAATAVVGVLALVYTAADTSRRRGSTATP
jgi:translocator protein